MMGWACEGYKIRQDETFMVAASSEYAGWKASYGPECNCGCRERAGPMATGKTSSSCGSSTVRNETMPSRSVHGTRPAETAPETADQISEAISTSHTVGWDSVRDIGNDITTVNLQPYGVTDGGGGSAADWGLTGGGCVLFSCCCPTRIQIIGGTPTVESLSWGQRKGAISYSIVVDFVTRISCFAQGGRCSTRRHEMMDRPGEPGKYDKWVDGEWNDASVNNESGREQAAREDRDQYYPEQLAALSPDGEFAYSYSLEDQPSIVSAFLQFGTITTNRKLLIFVHVKSGCVDCDDCCALILIDYSEFPFRMRTASGCGVECKLPNASGGSWSAHDTGRLYGRITEWEWTPGDLERVFEATDIGPIENVVWGAVQFY